MVKTRVVNNRQWLKIALIVLVITIVRTMVQPLIPESGPSPFPPSVFVESGLMPVAFVIYGVVMLGLLAIVFMLVQGRLPGSRLAKGLTFGLTFGMLWFVYLLEPLPHGSWEIPVCLYYPAVDGLTLASLGMALGVFVAVDSPKRRETPRISPATAAILAIPLAFGAGRLLSYSVFHIYSSWTARPLDTLLWIAAMGAWTAVMYLALCPGIGAKSPHGKALFFGIVVFGVNIFLNDMFMPIPFDIGLLGLGTFTYEDMIVRTTVDVLAVVAGVYASERLRRPAGDVPPAGGR